MKIIANLDEKQIEKLRELKTPHVFKNYKELCEYIGIKVAKGKQRIYDIKEIERHAKIENKKGEHKVTIEEVYGKSKAKQDNKKYGSHVKNLLMNHTIKSAEIDFSIEKSEMIHNREMSSFVQDTPLTLTSHSSRLIARNIYITPNQLMHQFKIINSNYRLCYYHVKTASRFLEIEYDYLNDFFNITKKHFGRVLNDAIEEIETENKLLQFTPWNMIIQDRYTHFPADEEINKIIFFREGQVLREMGFNSFQKVVVSSRYKEYKKRVVEKLNEKDGLDYIADYYTGYKIHFIISEGKELYKHSDEIIEYMKNKLNNIINNHVVKNAKKRHEKQITSIQEQMDSKYNYRSHEDYLDAYNKCIEIFLDPDARDIKKEFNDFRNKEKDKRRKTLDPFILELVEAGKFELEEED